MDEDEEKGGGGGEKANDDDTKAAKNASSSGDMITTMTYVLRTTTEFQSVCPLFFRQGSKTMRGLAKTLRSLPPPRQCSYRLHHCCGGGVPNSSLASENFKGNDVLHRASPRSIGTSSPPHQRPHDHHLPSPLLLIFRQTRTKTTTTTTSELCQEELEANIIRLSKSMARGLTSRGYWTNFDHHHHRHDGNDENSGSSSDGVVEVNKNNEDGGVVRQRQQQQQQQLLPHKVIINMRQQAMALRYIDKRYVQSVSESINIYTGQVERFVKPGVYACEPDGNDYYTAPDLLHYIATVLRTLPPILNDTILSTTTSTSTSTTTSTTQKLQLRNDAFNAKLAVTSAGGYKYPRHVDNVSPPPPPPSDDDGGSSSSNDVGDWDVRKLTIILYLNPDWKLGDGGELRLYLPTPITITTNDHNSNNNNNNNIDDDESSSTTNYIDLSPVGGRVVLFWSDEISHEVLANAPHIVPSSISVDDDDDDDLLSSKSQLLFDRYALTIWIPSDYDSLGHSFITPTATNITYV